MPDCGKHHPMEQMDAKGLTNYQLEFGSWWQCTRCHSIAIIPKEQLLAAMPEGRHRG